MDHNDLEELFPNAAKKEPKEQNKSNPYVRYCLRGSENLTHTKRHLIVEIDPLYTSLKIQVGSDEIRLAAKDLKQFLNLLSDIEFQYSLQERESTDWDTFYKKERGSNGK